MGFYYHIIASIIVISQVFFLVQAYTNYRYISAKYKRSRSWFRPKTALIIPCKGVDANFQENIGSFFAQDYENYRLKFVVAEKDDPAYKLLCQLKEELEHSSRVLDVQILIAGATETGSKKNHSLLYGSDRISADTEVLVFADSDICVGPDWLSHIVYPLHQPKNGVVSGYRWFVPIRNNSATLALSALNAKVAQLLGNTRFNQVWGGSMAIRVEDFRRLGIGKIWSKAISDDLSLSYAVKKVGLKVAFAPVCLVASYEATTWKKLFEFGRRQFLITRVSAPATWWVSLFLCFYFVAGFLGGIAMVTYAATAEPENLPLYAIMPAFLLLIQIVRAIIRQQMIHKLLKKDRHQMRFARLADIFFCWALTFVMLFIIISSAFGRTIRWRGIKYKLLGPTETIVIGKRKQTWVT